MSLNYPSPDAEDSETPPAARGAVLHTTAGDIEWEFYATDAPLTVKRMLHWLRRRMGVRKGSVRCPF